MIVWLRRSDLAKDLLLKDFKNHKYYSKNIERIRKKQILPSFEGKPGKLPPIEDSVQTSVHDASQT
jgi:hypothetical protein